MATITVNTDVTIHLNLRDIFNQLDDEDNDQITLGTITTHSQWYNEYLYFGPFHFDAYAQG